MELAGWAGYASLPSGSLVLGRGWAGYMWTEREGVAE